VQVADSVCRAAQLFVSDLSHMTLPSFRPSSRFSRWSLWHDLAAILVRMKRVAQSIAILVALATLAGCGASSHGSSGASSDVSSGSASGGNATSGGGSNASGSGGSSGSGGGGASGTSTPFVPTPDGGTGVTGTGGTLGQMPPPRPLSQLPNFGAPFIKTPTESNPVPCSSKVQGMARYTPATPTTCPTTFIDVQGGNGILAPFVSQRFNLNVWNPSGCPAKFAVREQGGGSVDSNGCYTAPAEAGLYHIDVFLKGASTAAFSATANVVIPPATGCADTSSIPVGTWQAINPPNVPIPGDFDCDFGVEGSVVVDPVFPGVLYVGTCQYGVYRSTSCGASGSWQKIDNSPAIDTGRQWTLVMDPWTYTLYTNSGYGAYGAGAYKSTDGGATWTQIWPPNPASNVTPPPSQVQVVNNFITQINLDPTRSGHVLMGFHQICQQVVNGQLATTTWNNPNTGKSMTIPLIWGNNPIGICYAESFDAGNSWTLHSGTPQWTNSTASYTEVPGTDIVESVTPYLLDSTHWLMSVHDASATTWYTADSGTTWTKAAPDQSAGHWPPELIRGAAGYYMGSDVGILFSADGASWNPAPVLQGSDMLGIAGNGQTIWASDFSGYQPTGLHNVNQVYFSAPDSATMAGSGAWTPVNWTLSTDLLSQGFQYIGTPNQTSTSFQFTQGGLMAYDPVNNFLYSANGTQGLWRLRVK
jgi:hypothetical protein